MNDFIPASTTIDVWCWSMLLCLCMICVGGRWRWLYNQSERNGTSVGHPKQASKENSVVGKGLEMVAQSTEIKLFIKVAARFLLLAGSATEESLVAASLSMLCYVMSSNHIITSNHITSRHRTSSGILQIQFHTDFDSLQWSVDIVT